jgi:starch phosphorylase
VSGKVVTGASEADYQVMSEQNPAVTFPYSHQSVLIDGYDSLEELALDMRWSWNHATDEVWRQLDSELWKITHNPWVVLQTASRDRIGGLLADPEFRAKVDGLLDAIRRATEAPACFQKNHAKTFLTCLVYFSMEFMLGEALPIVVGVGLLYQQGYNRAIAELKHHAGAAGCGVCYPVFYQKINSG